MSEHGEHDSRDEQHQRRADRRVVVQDVLDTGEHTARSVKERGDNIRLRSCLHWNPLVHLRQLVICGRPRRDGSSNLPQIVDGRVEARREAPMGGAGSAPTDLLTLGHRDAVDAADGLSVTSATPVL